MNSALGLLKLVMYLHPLLQILFQCSLTCLDLPHSISHQRLLNLTPLLQLALWLPATYNIPVLLGLVMLIIFDNLLQAINNILCPVITAKIHKDHFPFLVIPSNHSGDFSSQDRIHLLRGLMSLFSFKTIREVGEL